MVDVNWAGCHRFTAASFVEPRSVDELQELVATNRRVGVVGAAHSFNDIADTDGVLVSLRRLDRAVAVDPATSTVTVDGGIRYHELAARLHRDGWALHNLPSVPHFSVVGACATATHGSGDTNGGLATAIRALELVDGRGEMVVVEPGSEDLDGLAVAIGAAGIITSITLAVEPTFQVAQEVLLDLPVEQALEHLDEIMAGAYSVSLFTDWNGDTIDQLWRKHRVDAGTAPGASEPYRGAMPADVQVAPSGPRNAPLMTVQGLAPGPWHERLPHIDPRRELQPAGELQTEYFVRREHGPDAIAAVVAMGDLVAPLIRMAEVRTVAGDSLWMSPFRGDTLALHFSWITDLAAVMAILPAVEARLAPFQPLPHWGKLHTVPADVMKDGYPHLADFIALVDRHDPDGVFTNAHLDALRSDR